MSELPGVKVLDEPPRGPVTIQTVHNLEAAGLWEMAELARRIVARKPPLWRRVTLGKLLGAVAIAAALVAWELASRTGSVNPRFLSPPSEVFPALVRLVVDGTLLPHAALTLERIWVGFAIAVPFGILLGVAAGTWRWLEWLASPLIELIRAIPPLALLPVFLLFFGIGFRFPVAIVVWVAWVPVFLNTLAGIHNVAREIVEAARVDGASRWQIARLITFPLSMPYIVVGLRLGIGAAFLVVVAAEMMGDPHGLGFYILDASQTFRITEMYAAIILMGILAWGSNALIVAATRPLLRR